MAKPKTELVNLDTNMGGLCEVQEESAFQKLLNKNKTSLK
jgi:hypothetical protein